MKNSRKSSPMQRWLKENGRDGFTTFDFNKKEVIFYDGGFVSIKNKLKIYRKSKNFSFGEDKEMRKLACTFYFGALDETISHLIKMRDFLKKEGYSTSQTLISKEALKKL